MIDLIKITLLDPSLFEYLQFCDLGKVYNRRRSSLTSCERKELSIQSPPLFIGIVSSSPKILFIFDPGL